MSTYIIAEAGVNHNGDLGLAKRLVEVAAECGADAVKFQTFRAGKLAASTAPMAKYQMTGTQPGTSQFTMLQSLELPFDWHPELQSIAQELGIDFLSTAFDSESLAFLQTLNLPFFKVPSGEITNGPLLLDFARLGKRIVLSTGMATMGEIEQALAILSWGYLIDKDPPSMDEVWKHWGTQDAGRVILDNLTLLHCTSQYPAELHEINLAAMSSISKAFGLPTGYSDHSDGFLVPVAAAAMGAVILEKHFTLDRQLEGPDHLCSLEPHDLKRMVSDVRKVELLVGDGRKRPQSSEWDTRLAARQRLVASAPIRAGETFGAQNVTSSRSKSGAMPYMTWEIFGTLSNRDYVAGEGLT